MDTHPNKLISGWSLFSRFFFVIIIVSSIIYSLSHPPQNETLDPMKAESFVQRIQPCFATLSAIAPVRIIHRKVILTDEFSERNSSEVEMSYSQSQTNSFQKELPYLGYFQVGEEMTYEVSYLLLRLGTIKTKVAAIDKVNGKPQFKIEAHIRSYKGIPFTTISTIFQSTMNSHAYSESFGTREWYQDTTHKYINYTYNRKKDVVYISERIGDKKNMLNYDTLKLENKRYQDGLSLLFYARSNVFAKHEEKVPTLVYRTKADTYIRFGRERTSVEISAVDYPIDVIKLDGEAGFTGIFGLTGGFKGWFSADSACVPIFAQMRVIVGNVNIELIKWKRPGWNPPKALKP